MKKIREYIAENKKEVGLNILGLILAIVIVSGFFVFWSHYKVMWFCDEMYSYFNANSEYGLGPRVENGKWYDAQFVVDDMSADTSKGRFNITIHNTKGDEHPPIYFLTMRLMSIIMDGSISKWVGLSINLICVIGVCILTYILFYLITRKKLAALFVAVAVCSVPSALTSAMLIRMYCMLTAWGVLYVFLSYLVMQDYDKKVKKGLYVALALTTTCGFLTQYYFAVFAVGFTAVYCVWFAVKKQWNDIKWFLGSMFSSVILATILWKSWVRQMFLGYCGKDVLSSAFDFSKLFDEMIYAFTCMPKLMFYDYYIVCMILILAGMIFLIVKKNKNVSIISMLLLGALFYCMVVAHVTPSYYMDSRYFYLPTSIAYIGVFLIFVSCMEYIPQKKIKTILVNLVLVGVIAFNTWTAWYNDMAMGYVDKSRAYFEKLEILKEYSDIPWMFYGYECWSMMENYYDMALGSRFIVYNDINDFDSFKCPTDGEDFVIMINSNSYPEPELILDKLNYSEGCEHEFEFLFFKSANFYVIRHK